ncbi:SusC/RagA family TonB-linked outer membrane protein [Algoriphagus aquimarinus]|nr:SusC/RagA family TonB-linked outer membrane protein [Algoriphagus aquimarinus]
MGKYAFFGMLLQCLFFSVLLASNSSGQTRIDKVFLSLSETNLPVVEVFHKIERETDFKFSFRSSDVGQQRFLNPASGKKVSIEYLLQEISKTSNLKFKQVNNTIHVGAKAIQTPIFEVAEVTVSGVILDENQVPMPGVTITVSGTTNGTISDIDGKYSITVDEDAVLVFSFIGFIKQTIQVGSRSQLDVVLLEDARSLEEVIVVGYGTQKKVNLTGAITAVSTEDFSDVPLTNLSNGLAGRAPGVQVVGTSGLAGASSSIRIRGSVGEPLYVINGIIRNKADFDALNPNEVENISFLKDAASAAIYGSSAGNGVVLVKTKGGANQKPVFEYKGNYSTSNPTRPLQDFNAQEEIRFLNNSAVSNGLPEQYGQEILDYFSDKSYSINDLIWQNPTIQEHNLSVRGGSEDVSYYVMMGYHAEEGSYKNLGFDRYNFRTDLTAKITENLKLNLNVSGNERNYNRWYWPYDGAEDFNVGDFYRATFNWSRLYPFYVDEEGNPTNNPNDLPVMRGGWHPPQLMLNEGGYRDTKYRTLDGIMRLDLNLGNLIEGLSTSVQGNINANDRNMKSFVVHNKFYLTQSAGVANVFIPGPVDYTQTGTHNLSSGYENIQEDVTLGSSYQLDWYLNYDRTFKKHSVSGLMVYEQAGSNSKNIGGRAEDLLSTEIDQIYNSSSDTERRWFYGSESQFARASWIGRAKYSYSEKYLAEFSFRYDGNYKFAPGNQWGFFPSGSVGWRIIEEDFMKNQNFLDELKFRASYGTTGSDSGIGAWRWSQVYQKSGGYVFGSTLYDGLVPGAVPNPGITWSTVSMWNLGLDFAFLNNRLVGEFDVWGKTESDILGTRLGSTPTTYGASLPAVNYAEKSWKGFELNMDWRDRIGEFSYSVYGNMGFAKDQWDIFDEPESYTDGTYEGNWRSTIGQPANRVFGYISKGIIRTQAELDALDPSFKQFGRAPIIGGLLFEDIRGANYSEGPDGKIDSNDQTYLSDNGAPRINYGFGFKGDWKGITFNAHFQGVGAYDRMVSTRNGGGVFQVGEKPYFEIWAKDNYWTPENPNAEYPRVNGQWMQPEVGGGPSSFWLRNGAYMRLRNLNLGYNLPEKWFSKSGNTKIQIYGNATNLFVISDLKEHDPEQNTLDSYPLMKTFTAGLVVQF